MDPTRFDALARNLAAPRTRRGLLGGLVALAVGARAATAQTDCPPRQTRNQKGQCGCPAGTDACPDGCFDRKRDPSNCGRCGNACLPGQICQKGECRCPRGATCGCPSGASPCNGTCLDPEGYRFDANNCGGCGTVCGDGGDPCRVPRCTEGVCVTDPLDCEDGNPCTSNRCRDGGCVTGFLSGGACTTEGGAAGTCASGTCVENTTTTTTTTTEPPTTTTSTTTTTAAPCTGTTCAGACCLPGQGDCLANGSCAETCSGGDCPGGCICTFGSADGTSRCLQLVLNCAAVTQQCSSTADCPRGQQCGLIGCGPNGTFLNFCWNLCATA